nr:PREDICTED: LOW QUALITY PROTEIN: uncharacterized protein LOC105668094 [Linepithema humile]
MLTSYGCHYAQWYTYLLTSWAEVRENATRRRAPDAEASTDLKDGALWDIMDAGSEALKITRARDRSKTTCQGSYAQATKELVRIAVIMNSYPEKKIGAEEESLIARKLIRGRILELMGKEKAPNLTSSWVKDGALFGCADEYSEGWLKSLSSDIKIGETSLCVMPIDELQKRHRMVVHIEESDITTEETLKFLRLQNTGLTTSDWIVTRSSKKRDSKSAQFACLVGETSLKAINTGNPV